MTAVSPRLPAAERRLALIETAIRVFSDGSYRGTTTSEIARAALHSASGSGAVARVAVNVAP